ncbi:MULTISPECIES: sigma-70 family RNA polymerase sigma factor [Pseudomonas]|uniref:sigma-70 family RNA polymerase sigma factor n=1 Tax=Pseudomonas sp. AU12215 TaxID=1860123 RepID=UPI0004B7ED1A|nr:MULTISPECIES: sigma-70 family RNA polymerase sigma factor [Pseudomonas]UCL84461.1 sigma-70 family RNA polymerase sigma factor [Pseudomonas sp. HS-18]
MESAFIRYYKELVLYLNRSLGDRQAAADVTQEAFLRLLDRKGDEHIEQPRAFLYRTAVNLSIDLHRRGRVRRTEELETLDREGCLDERCPQEEASRQQQLQLLQRALGELPENCRRAFLLRKVEGCSHIEIAETMGISRDMVEKHIVNAMKHCRLRLRAWGVQG